MKFFVRLKNSVIKFEEYINFSNEKINTGIVYFMKLMLLFSLILTIVFTYRIYVLMESGELNTIYEEVVYRHNLEAINEQTISDFIEDTHWFVLYGIFFATGFISHFMVYSILTLTHVLILSVLGFLISRIFRINFRYLPILNMSFHAITLPVILAGAYFSVNILIDFEIRFFRIAYDAIAYIYILTAMLLIKSDLLKKQMELIKIEQVQKEVREEIEDSRTEKEEKQEENEEELDEDIPDTPSTETT